MPVWFRAILFIVLVPGVVAGWLPWYIAGRPALPPARGGAAGLTIAVLGWAVLLWCARDFAVRGRGTLAPIDPPRALVTAGLYQFVRNPMYVGVVTSLAGQAWWYNSRDVLVYAVVVALFFHLRVVLFEEPRLARDFGPEYAAYRERVPRWLPRLRRRTIRPVVRRPSNGGG